MTHLFTSPTGASAAVALMPAGLGLLVAAVAIAIGARAESAGRSSEFSSWMLLTAAPFVFVTVAWEAVLGWHAVGSWGILGETAQMLLALIGALAALGAVGMLAVCVLGRVSGR